MRLSYLPFGLLESIVFPLKNFRLILKLLQLLEDVHVMMNYVFELRFLILVPLVDKLEVSLLNRKIAEFRHPFIINYISY